MNMNEIIHVNVVTVPMCDIIEGSENLSENATAEAFHDDASCGLNVSYDYLVKISSEHRILYITNQKKIKLSDN